MQIIQSRNALRTYLWVQTLNEEPLFSLNKIPKLIAVSGNIGVGKTTFINNYKSLHPDEDVVLLKEDMDKWKVIFSQYYDIVSSNKKEYTIEEQALVAQFQLMTAVTRLQQYQLIDYNSNKTYIFERTIQESLDCFLPVLRRIITNDVIYETIFDLQHELCLLEPQFTETIHLKQSVPVCYDRIIKRNTEGEQVDIDYLYELDNKYRFFKQRNNHLFHKYKNQQYIVGGIGSGKTTFLHKLQQVGTKIMTEPIDYWNYSDEFSLLEKHINNISQKEYSTPWTFIFQCRVLCSRLRYRADDTVYERNIFEEPKIFMKSYKHCFTQTQYDLLQQLYAIILPMFEDGIFYYMGTSPERQYQNIVVRARKGEEQYTFDMIKNVHSMYQEIIDMFKGKVYYISYD